MSLKTESFKDEEMSSVFQGSTEDQTHDSFRKHTLQNYQTSTFNIRLSEVYVCSEETLEFVFVWLHLTCQGVIMAASNG